MLPGRRRSTRTRCATHARALGLPVADKPDSQEICFVPDGDYAAFVERARRRRRGRRDPRRRRTRSSARHDGVHRFTVGQRKGLGLSSPIPLYVVGIDAGERARSPSARATRSSARTLTASGVNWIAGSRPPPASRVTAQIRHRHPRGGRRRSVRWTTTGCRSTFDSRRPPSRRARRWCSTTATWWSAAGGSSRN